MNSLLRRSTRVTIRFSLPLVFEGGLPWQNMLFGKHLNLLKVLECDSRRGFHFAVISVFHLSNMLWSWMNTISRQRRMHTRKVLEGVSSAWLSFSIPRSKVTEYRHCMLLDDSMIFVCAHHAGEA